MTCFVRCLSFRSQCNVISFSLVLLSLRDYWSDPVDAIIPLALSRACFLFSFFLFVCFYGVFFSLVARVVLIGENGGAFTQLVSNTATHGWQSCNCVCSGTVISCPQRRLLKSRLRVHFRLIAQPYLLHYSNLQCHMLLHKSFYYADLVLKKHLSFIISV